MAKRGTYGQFVSNLILRGALGAALALPYRWRVPLMGWFTSRIASPLAGYGRRIRANLALVCPDLQEAEIKALCRSVPDNVGRSLIEIYSGDDFAKRAASHEIEGPGLAALERARAEGRPVVLVTGHFGNYDAPRAALIARGFDLGALYKPMGNPYFNAHYERAIAKIGEPIFPKDRRGIADMLRFLKGGGVLGFFIDNHVGTGEQVDFFNHPAWTTLAAAEMALKQDALILMVFGVRQPDGLTFRIVINAPIEHTTAIEMTQELTNQLEEMVRQHMDQWLWIHRRWKDSAVTPTVPPQESDRD